MCRATRVRDWNCGFKPSASCAGASVGAELARSGAVMELYADSISDAVSTFGWLLRTMMNGVIWGATGQFMPTNCTWCRPAWMAGLGMGAVLVFVYFSGPRRD